MISQVYKYADTNILVGITSHESDSKTDRQDGAEWTGTSCRAAMLWHLDSAMPHSMTGAPDWRPGVEQCDLATHSVTVSNDSQHDRCPRLATHSHSEQCFTAWQVPSTSHTQWQWAMPHSMTGAPNWPHSYSEQCLTAWQVPSTSHTQSQWAMPHSMTGASNWPHTITVSNASQHVRCPRLTARCSTVWPKESKSKVVWVYLQDDVISVPSLSTSRQHLKTFLFPASFPDIVIDNA